MTAKKVVFNATLSHEYDQLFKTCKADPDKKNKIQAMVDQFLAGKAQYISIAAKTKVPWHIIAAIHSMECSFSFKRHLHNGDPLTDRTTHEPKGYPKTGTPPFTFEASAIDALTNRMHLDTWKDWSIAGSLYKLESFNGLGYRQYHSNVLTPYLWSNSNHYTKGKYVSDGTFSEDAVSAQPGIAVIFKVLLEKKEIVFGDPVFHAVKYPLRYSFPVNVDKLKQEPTGTNTQAYFDHTEKEGNAGFFPLGTNTVWHGGVHIRVDKGTEVFSTTPGTIIAARLPSDPKLAIGTYGSHNFILIRHKVSGADMNQQFYPGSRAPKFPESSTHVFYSLFMHLNNEKLVATENMALSSRPWLGNVKKYTVTKACRLHSTADTSDPSAICKLEKGVELVPKDQGIIDAFNYQWCHVTIKTGTYSGKEGYAPISGPLGSFLQASADVNGALLKALDTGEVVSLNVQVDAGEPLWSTGEYGSTSTSLLHWSIFSEENLFPSYVPIDETDSNNDMDCKQIWELIGGAGTKQRMDLSVKELCEFYQKNKKAEDLRKYACRFISEWAIDPKVVRRTWGSYVKLGDFEANLREYLWWNDAKAKKVTLPASAHVWHYNPIAVVGDLSGAMLNELEQLLRKPELTPQEIAKARELIQKKPATDRPALWLRLQQKVKYRNQRNNNQTGAVADRMCNLTSLSMCLEYLGIACPKPEMQFEDYLEQERVDHAFDARTSCETWENLAKLFKVTMQTIDLQTDQKKKLTDKLKPPLASGKGVLISIFSVASTKGHIVRLQEVTDEGLIVDDPFGKLNNFAQREAGGSGYTGTGNTRTTESGVGSDNLWKWADISQTVIKYAQAFSNS